MPTALRAAAPPAPPGEALGLRGQASLDQPQLHRARMFWNSAPRWGGGLFWGGGRDRALAVWPLFIRILVGVGWGNFLFEVYDLPAFQDPTTHKFKVAMKFLFLWASQAGAF